MPDKFVGSIPVLAGKQWDRAAIELHEYLRKANYAHNLQEDIQAISLGGTNTTGTLTVLNSGTIYFSAGNNLTLSQSGQSIGISGPTLMSLGVSTGGNTAGTTGLVASRVVLYGGSNVSLSQSVSGQSATITWNVHPPIGIAAGTQTATIGTVIFSNSNNVTFGMSGSNTITASVTIAPQTGISGVSAGTTQVTSGTISFADSNGISFGIDGQTLTGSVAVLALGTQTFGVTDSALIGGATAGTTGGVTGTGIQYALVAGGNITLSQSINGSSGTLTIAAASLAEEFQTIGMASSTAGGGTGGGTNRATGAGVDINFYAGSGITLSQTTGGIGQSASLTLYAGEILSYYANLPALLNAQTTTMLQSTSGMIPFSLPNSLSVGFMRVPVLGGVVGASTTRVTVANSQFSGGHSRTYNLVLYTRGNGANSDSLALYGSTSAGMTYSMNVSAATNSTEYSYSARYTFPCSSGTTGFTKDYSSSAASVNIHTSHVTDLTGNKVLEIPFATLLTPGQYFLGFGISSTTGFNLGFDVLTRPAIAFTHYGVSQVNSGWGTLGADTNSSVNIQPGLGSFTIPGGGTTASLELSRLSSNASQNVLYFQFMRVT